jgi:hypothetical protein
MITGYTSRWQCFWALQKLSLHALVVGPERMARALRSAYEEVAIQPGSADTILKDMFQAKLRGDQAEFDRLYKLVKG